MENIKNLIARYRQTGFLFIIGLILIIYVALGFLYLQQDPQQREFEEQIVKLTAILANPLPSSKELQAKYDDVNRALAPMNDTDAIALLVAIAEESGIDISEDSDNLRVPTASPSGTNVDGGTYQLISFGGIHVQGDYENVMAFLSILDSGSKLENMVLTRVVTEEVTVVATGEEGTRRAEFRSVISAVLDMMNKNDLLVIPNPMSFSRSTATNLMGDNVSTALTTEGFPDITTPAAEKGYTGIVTPRNGYVLYEHDKISTDNTTQYETVNYFPDLTTSYYYTCEADGTVRQWDGPNVTTATEYLDSAESKNELKVTLDVNIYTKSE